MKAMILAAGLGKRMRPLTDHCPKPLLKVAGKPLLQYHLEALAAGGIEQVVINLAYRGEQIREWAGDGERFGLSINYSPEPEPLETGGALLKALPLLGSDPFLLVNGDVWTDYPLTQLSEPHLPPSMDGRLLLVANPEFHPGGDFALDPNDRLSDEPGLPSYTYAGIGLLHPRLIADYPGRRAIFPLLEVLQPALTQGHLEGRLHRGRWSDVGTPQRLEHLNRELIDL